MFERCDGEVYLVTEFDEGDWYYKHGYKNVIVMSDDVETGRRLGYHGNVDRQKKIISGWWWMDLGSIEGGWQRVEIVRAYVKLDTVEEIKPLKVKSKVSRPTIANYVWSTTNNISSSTDGM